MCLAEHFPHIKGILDEEKNNFQNDISFNSQIVWLYCYMFSKNIHVLLQYINNINTKCLFANEKSAIQECSQGPVSGKDVIWP